MKPIGKKIFPFSWYYPNWLIGDFVDELGLLDSVIWFICIIGMCGFWAFLSMSWN